MQDFPNPAIQNRDQTHMQLPSQTLSQAQGLEHSIIRDKSTQMVMYKDQNDAHSKAPGPRQLHTRNGYNKFPNNCKDFKNLTKWDMQKRDP